MCGSRNATDPGCVYACLGHIARVVGYPSMVLVGDAPGIDTYARRWAQAHGIPGLLHRADWLRHGRAAGPIRNARMLENLLSCRPEHRWLRPHSAEVPLVVAFPGGSGTYDMVQRARAVEIEVIEVP